MNREIHCSNCQRSITPSTLLRHKRSVSALETQSRVLLCASIETDNTRGFLLLRVDVDAVSLEAIARRVRVALDDESFGLGEVREAVVIPAGLIDTNWLAWPSCTGRNLVDLTLVRQEPSPGLKLLMSPVKLPKVKSRSSTLELFGRSALPAFPWSTYVWSLVSHCLSVDIWVEGGLPG